MQNKITDYESLTFDDVLLLPALSNVKPAEVITRTRIASRIELNIPILSAAMDTVTEAPMAIAMAQSGGIGVIHRNLPIGKQVEEVRRVKRFESGMVTNPITISPESSLAEALDLMQTYRISGIPVVDQTSQQVIGILTNRDVRFVEDTATPVAQLMTKENLITVQGQPDREQARQLLHENRIEKLIVLDDQGRCAGLITVKDIQNSVVNPNATKDSHGRLRVAAAVGVGKDGYDRAQALADAEVDIVIVDTAHGHHKDVLGVVSKIAQLQSNKVQVIAGNVATADGARALIDCGANAVKVGIGPGSICTTRIIAGIGVPQLTAIMQVADACAATGTPVIADGGIKQSGDIGKAIAAGADAVMMGSMLAGTDEAPGEVVYYQGRSYKSYRGMGSQGAMVAGSADRYGQSQDTAERKMVPEGIEGRVPYKGSVRDVLHQNMGGLRATMGYTGSEDIEALKYGTKFTRITGAGMRESHVHDVTITRESPNYHNKS
jgi:IMP dehydrogenase